MKPLSLSVTYISPEINSGFCNMKRLSTSQVTCLTQENNADRMTPEGWARNRNVRSGVQLVNDTIRLALVGSLEMQLILAKIEHCVLDSVPYVKTPLTLCIVGPQWNESIEYSIHQNNFLLVSTYFPIMTLKNKFCALLACVAGGIRERVIFGGGAAILLGSLRW